METREQQLESAVLHLLPLALAHLRELSKNLVSEEDDTVDGLASPEKWELSRRYYAAKNLVSSETVE